MRTALTSALPALSLLALFPLMASGAAPPPSCTGSEYRQFDFWLGDWNVFTPDGKLAGTSRIERITAGCAVLENWSGQGGITGKSLNIYDATSMTRPTGSGTSSGSIPAARKRCSRAASPPAR